MKPAAACAVPPSKKDTIRLQWARVFSDADGRCFLSLLESASGSLCPRWRSARPQSGSTSSPLPPPNPPACFSVSFPDPHVNNRVRKTLHTESRPESGYIIQRQYGG
ncbi:hypothetical protein DFH09DRAFT_1086797 [Mycena vulgaris]|nr:hypothetical protein DFH09DRAFT_1086797 [Mycena vulgaris]